MTMITNPYGTQRDLLAFDDRLYDVDWDGLWRCTYLSLRLWLGGRNGHSLANTSLS